MCPVCSALVLPPATHWVKPIIFKPVQFLKQDLALIISTGMLSSIIKANFFRMELVTALFGWILLNAIPHLRQTSSCIHGSTVWAN